MSKWRTNHNLSFMARVALEAIRGKKTIGQLAARCEVHPSQTQAWKKAWSLLERGDGVVGGNREKQRKADEALRARLYHSAFGEAT